MLGFEYCCMYIFYSVYTVQYGTIVGLKNQLWKMGGTDTIYNTPNHAPSLLRLEESNRVISLVFVKFKSSQPPHPFLRPKSFIPNFLIFS